MTMGLSNIAQCRKLDDPIFRHHEHHVLWNDIWGGTSDIFVMRGDGFLELRRTAALTPFFEFFRIADTVIVRKEYIATIDAGISLMNNARLPSPDTAISVELADLNSKNPFTNFVPSFDVDCVPHLFLPVSGHKTGKSIMTFVILILRLRAKLPTVYQLTTERFFIYNSEGAFCVEEKDFYRLDAHIADLISVLPIDLVWVLVDTRAEWPAQPLEESFFVLCCTSPGEELRWLRACCTPPHLWYIQMCSLKVAMLGDADIYRLISRSQRQKSASPNIFSTSGEISAASSEDSVASGSSDEAEVAKNMIEPSKPLRIRLRSNVSRHGSSSTGGSRAQHRRAHVGDDGRASLQIWSC